MTKTSDRKVISKLEQLPKVVVLIVVVIYSIFTSASHADVLTDAIEHGQAMSKAKLISRADFIDSQDSLSAIKISSDGQYLAYITRDNDKQQLWLRNNNTGNKELKFTSGILRNIYWAANSASLFLHLDTGVAVLNMLPNARPEIIVRLDRKKQQYFYGVDKLSPQHFFLWMEKFQAKTKVSVYSLFRVDIEGKKTLLYEADEINNFYALPQGPVKFISKTESNIFSIIDISHEQNKQIFTCHFTDYCRLLRYNNKTNKLYVIARMEHDLSRIIEVDLTNNEIRTIHYDPQNTFDIESVSFDVTTGLPLIASYQTDYFKNYGLNDEVQQHIDRIEKLIPSNIMKIYASLKATNWLVVDSNPTKFNRQIFLYSPKSGSLTQILKDVTERDYYTQLQSHLAQRVAIQYEASDKMLLHGYVTLPKGVNLASASVVVDVHGGPFSRRTGGNTTIAQLLANRGHIVFEPNFRASTGFGRNYSNSANRDFGKGRVQQDIIDGLEYLLSRGIGHRNRLAITGGSFGGFATLTALTFTPTLFKVGIAISPGTAMSKTGRYLASSLNKQKRPNMLARFAYRIVDINDPSDVAISDAKSPSAHIDKVLNPIYIVAGELDPRVSILNVRDYALRLEAAGKQVTLLSAPNEGHIYQDRIAVEARYWLLEEALHKHVGGRVEANVDNKVIRFLEKNLTLKVGEASAINR
jgi:dipeptidyl aminopeptidase/acylaminoacyl peptidase